MLVYNDKINFKLCNFKKSNVASFVVAKFILYNIQNSFFLQCIYKILKLKVIKYKPLSLSMLSDSVYPGGQRYLYHFRSVAHRLIYPFTVTLQSLQADRIICKLINSLQISS